MKERSGNKGLKDAEAMEAKACTAFGGGRYKEAIDLYKTLLKKERNPAWIDGLATSYEAMAHVRAGKGFLQEALKLCKIARIFAGSR